MHATSRAAHAAFSREPQRRCACPLASLLLRCFPQKTSARNFARYCASKTHVPDDVAGHVLKAMSDMLVLEMPLSCKPRQQLTSNALARVRHALGSATPADLRRWLSGPPSRFAPVYLALRWRVVCAVQDASGLRAALEYHMSTWSTYEDFIASQVCSVRRAVNAAGPNDRLLGSCDEAASSTRGMRVVVTSSPPPMSAMVRRAAIVISIIRTRQAPPAPRNAQAASMLLRCAWRASSVEMIHLLTQMGMCSSALNFWSSLSASVDRRAVVKWLSTLRPDQLQLTLELGRALIVRGKARLHRLSQNCLRRQCESRRRRTNLKLLTTKPYIFACPTCTQVRGFVCPATCASSGNGRQPHGMDNYCAMGTSRCIIDFDNNLLYCGRRVERSTLGGADCRDSLLLKVPIDGYVLEWFGQFLMLCPGCTRLVAHPSMPDTGSDTYGPDGLFRCVRCRCGGDETPAQRLPPCDHCGETVSSAASHTWRSCTFCSRCRRKWMVPNNDAIHLPMDVVHRAIDHRWPPARVARAASQHLKEIAD